MKRANPLHAEVPFYLTGEWAVTSLLDGRTFHTISLDKEVVWLPEPDMRGVTAGIVMGEISEEHVAEVANHADRKWMMANVWHKLGIYTHVSQHFLALLEKGVREGDEEVYPLVVTAHIEGYQLTEIHAETTPELKRHFVVYWVDGEQPSVVEDFPSAMYRSRDENKSIAFIEEGREPSHEWYETSWRKK